MKNGSFNVRFCAIYGLSILRMLLVLVHRTFVGALKGTVNWKPLRPRQNRRSTTYAVIFVPQSPAPSRILRKSEVSTALVNCLCCVQGCPAEMQTWTHRNLISCRMNPTFVLSPGNILMKHLFQWIHSYKKDLDVHFKMILLLFLLVFKLRKSGIA
jgi:hypothetical protein